MCFGFWLGCCFVGVVVVFPGAGLTGARWAWSGVFWGDGVGQRMLCGCSAFWHVGLGASGGGEVVAGLAFVAVVGSSGLLLQLGFWGILVWS